MGSDEHRLKGNGFDPPQNVQGDLGLKKRLRAPRRWTQKSGFGENRKLRDSETGM
ncbi:MAG: hypothetical protein LWX55_08305 [Deltaproteobacteria bacterium]|nr:hypothetical protein [Deltaproteobacteria bacterium]